MSSRTRHRRRSPAAAPQPESATWFSAIALALRRYVRSAFTLDERSLAMFRIGIALILLFDLYYRALDLRVFYTDAGVYPRALMPTFRMSLLHAVSGSAWWQALLMIIAASFAVFLLVGFYTRLALCVSWLLLFSIQVRNPEILQGGDILLRVLMFWGMFLPLGACWSVDSARRPERAPATDDSQAAGCCSMAAACLILQICFMYWFGAILKSDPIWRSEGSAVYYALSLEQFTTPFGQIMLGYPDVLRFLTFATLWLEGRGPWFLFFPFFMQPIRTVVVMSFLMFHLVGLNLTMNLGPFPYICAVAWLALLPAWFWDKLAVFGRRREAQPQEIDAPGSHADVRRIRRDGVVPRQPRQGLRRALAIARDIALALVLLYVLLWNVRTTNHARFSKFFPGSVDIIGYTLGVDQAWSMFAPHPLQDTGWYVVLGKLADGTEVDLLKGQGPPSFAEPELISATFPRERWRKYLLNLWPHPDNPGSNTGDLRRHYADYLRRTWNETHAWDKALERVEIYFVWRRILPDGQHLDKERLRDLLWPMPGIE